MKSFREAPKAYTFGIAAALAYTGFAYSALKNAEPPESTHTETAVTVLFNKQYASDYTPDCLTETDYDPIRSPGTAKLGYGTRLGSVFGEVRPEATVVEQQDGLVTVTPSVEKFAGQILTFSIKPETNILQPEGQFTEDFMADRNC